jgi:hypothetical protein
MGRSVRSFPTYPFRPPELDGASVTTRRDRGAAVGLTLAAGLAPGSAPS